MAAFNWPGGCPDPKPQKPLYIKSQPTIYLYNEDELLDEINAAEQANTDRVYIKNPGHATGHTAIDLWYAKALYERIK